MNSTTSAPHQASVRNTNPLTGGRRVGGKGDCEWEREREREIMVVSGTEQRVKLDPIKTAGTRWERIYK